MCSKGFRNPFHFVLVEMTMILLGLFILLQLFGQISPTVCINQSPNVLPCYKGIMQYRKQTFECTSLPFFRNKDNTWSCKYR